jgi:hypothetical protein
MYCQCGLGNRISDAALVSQGRSAERESAENMNRGCLREKVLIRVRAESKESAGLK